MIKSSDSNLSQNLYLVTFPYVNTTFQFAPPKNEKYLLCQNSINDNFVEQYFQPN